MRGVSRNLSLDLSLRLLRDPTPRPWSFYQKGLPPVNEEQPEEQNETEADHSFPCDECGSMVDLSAMIKVSDGNAWTLMSEFDARALLDELGIPRPPVRCKDHTDLGDVTTEAFRA